MKTDLARIFGLAVLASVPLSGVVASQEQTRVEPRASARCFEGSQQERREAAKAALHALPRHYWDWLAEDAGYIITPEERCEFLKLESDQEREQFIERFWMRRSDDPESLRNGFEEEHYRRIVYANEHFGTEIAGWKLDRGRIYIIFGPPDQIEAHRRGEATARKEGTPGATYPDSWERWRYKYVEGIGADLEVDFIDPTGTGDFRLVMSDALLNKLLVPRWRDWKDGTEFGESDDETKDRVEIYIKGAPVAKIRYKDLEALTGAQIERDQVAFTYEVGYQPVTHATTLAKIALSLPPGKPGGTPAAGASQFAIFGRISRPDGWVASTFELATSEGESPGSPANQAEIPLPAGSYRLALAVKDVATGEAGTRFMTIEVPSLQ